MSRLTNYQIINSESGEPLFAVIPYEEFQQIRKHIEDEELTLPNKVVGLHILEGKSLLCAWREYKGISPDEMAEDMGMTSDEYLQTENKKILSPHILKKAAEVLGTDSRLLTED